MLNFFKNQGNSSSPSSSRGKVVAILNQKGGVGKTTMTFNLAHALAQRGQKVLCLDLDPQANLSLLFDLPEDKREIFSLLLNSVKELKPLHRDLLFSETLFRVEAPVPIDVIGSSQELSGFELTMAGISAPRQLILKKCIDLNQLTQLYDVILIDAPPTLGLLVVNILCACHGVMVPFQPDQFSRVGLEHFHHALEDVEEMGIGAQPKVIGYIPNLVESRRKQSEEDFTKIASHLEANKIFPSFPNRAPLARAGQQKKSVFSFKGKAYQEMQNQFLTMADRIKEFSL